MMSSLDYEQTQQGPAGSAGANPVLRLTFAASGDDQGLGVVESAVTPGPSFLKSGLVVYMSMLPGHCTFALKVGMSLSL